MKTFGIHSLIREKKLWGIKQWQKYHVHSYIDGFVFEKLLGKRNLLNLDQIFEYDQVIKNNIWECLTLISVFHLRARMAGVSFCQKPLGNQISKQ